jgi:microcystin-dependent protein
MQPFVGQLLLVPYNFAPQGWAFCQGQLLAISENDTLFNLIGTTYGGDGQSTFAVPNLQGRTAIHMGQGPGLQNYTLGSSQGVEQVTLTNNQTGHTHVAGCSENQNSSAIVNGAVLARGPAIYTADTPPNATLAASTVNVQGGSQPHDNRQPFLTLNWVISLFGIFPSQS